MTTNRALLTLLQGYQRTYELAVQVFSLYEDASSAELLRIHEQLGRSATALIEDSGLDWSQCGSLGRHLNFLTYYLKRNDKESCFADIRDILIYDLPATLRALLDTAKEDSYLDERLRDSVYPLLDGGHFDSAIRKVFVILTERLRRSFGVRDDVDGEDLVNLVFGKGGQIPVALSESKKIALRNLLSGFYGLYRNRYAHNDTFANFGDARAIVEMGNQILFEIETVASVSAREAK